LVSSAATNSAAKYLTEINPALAFGAGASGRVMVTKRPVLMENAAIDDLLAPETRVVVQNHGFHGTIIVPLLANHRSVGTLTVVDTRIRRFTDDESSLLSAFADQASLALEKARLLNEAEREKERSDALYRVSNLLASAHDTDEVLDLIINEATRLVGASGAWIRLLEGDFLVNGPATASSALFVSEIAAAVPAGETSLAGQ